jgi:radical SAM superfamily enzyme YgiQ (UPF0313 family)
LASSAQAAIRNGLGVKLALIAMSGIRVQDAELTRLGLTLPGFVERARVVASLPSLALLTLAGLTPPDVAVEYLEVPDLSQVDGLPGEFDVVAIASYTAQIKDAYELADRYRSAGTKVILGGLHVSALPDEARPHADSVVLGEAEAIWPQVVHDLQRGMVRPGYDARGESFDLARAPMPRFDLLDVDRYNRLTVQTQRGCPLSCEFCASSIRIAPKFKVKPVERVIAEIRRIKEMWRDPFIEFADDNTFASKAHGKRLLREVAKEHLRWFTETDISVADDDELLTLLQQSGCKQILVGLEAPGRTALEGIEAKSNWKANRVDTYVEAIGKIQRAGITVNGCFILGLDTQDGDSFAEVAAFVRESGLYEVQVTIQTPFPGTPLYRRLKEEGRLLSDDPWERCTLFDVTFRPHRMSVEELEKGFRSLVRELYAVEATHRRRRQFREARDMREARAIVAADPGGVAVRNKT